jgi:hypothetical protein
MEIRARVLLAALDLMPHVLIERSGSLSFDRPLVLPKYTAVTN